MSTVLYLCIILIAAEACAAHGHHQRDKEAENNGDDHHDGGNDKYSHSIGRHSDDNEHGPHGGHHDHEKYHHSDINGEEGEHDHHSCRGHGRHRPCQPGNNPKPDTANPLTVTPMGAIRGSWMQSRRGRRIQAYRGVRYAQAPVGELRFQPPVPIAKYDGEVDASKEGPACPLPVDIPYFVDEDCLMLNVYTPEKTDRTKPLPVVVYFHPGGFYAMTGRSDLFGPQYLLDRDIILVTSNYRLASLGFLATGDELAPGNNALKDQVVVLRWVQKNIAAFGGDPNLVTIAGCSAGSISVMLHMISPMSKGLFHRAISMSGSPTAKVPSPTDMYDLAVKQAQLVGCPDHSSKVIIDCLKTKPWKELADSLSGFFALGFDPIGVWLPNVEPDFGQERFLPIEPMDAIREGKMHAVPFIVSQTEEEFYWLAVNVFNNASLLTRLTNEWETLAPISFMLPKENSGPALDRLTQSYLGGKLTNTSRSENGLGKLYGDAITGFPVHRMANLMCRHSPQPVYYYEFSYFGEHSYWEDPVTKKPIGAMHHDDQIYLFSQTYRFPDIPLSSPDAIISERMTAIFANFARHGDPNPRGDLPELSSLSWPPMKPEDRKYLRIGKDFSVHQKLKEDRFQIWDEIYPIQY